MLFSSTVFLFAFLPLVLLCYFASGKKYRNLVLLVFSLLFYAWGEPVYVVLMILSCGVNFILGKLVYRYKWEENYQSEKKTKAVIICTLCFNLGLLGFFKYIDFFIENLNHILPVSISPLHLALPIGISFYTFQSMSYVFDVYRKDAKLQKNFLDLMMYVSLFPQLIAGPIVRYQTVANEINERHESLDEAGEGISLFIIGLGKKVLFANTIGELFTQLGNLDASQQSLGLMWLSAIAYGLQIYFDFSGYSDMAMGLGKIFGFHFLKNFNYPYISTSITEFWRRWHISLGTWFRDYVYIPLGGSRCSKLKMYRNIMVVWMLTGFWHGASWNFVLWGFSFGVILLIEKTFLLKWLEKLPKVVGHIYTLLLVLLSWVIFAYDKIEVGISHIVSMFGFGKLPVWNEATSYYLVSYGLLFAILIFASTPVPKAIHLHLKRKLKGKGHTVYELVVSPAFVLIVLLLSTAYLVSNSFNPFLYFRF